VTETKAKAKYKPERETKSAAKVLKVLDVLLRNFVHGFTPGELAEETKYAPSDITTYVTTLVNAGFAERIQETQRIRASHRLAKSALQILNSIESAEARLAETKKRIIGA